MTTKAHLVAYGALAAVLLGVLYLWHDTRINDAAQAAQLKQTVQTATQELKQAQQAIAERDAAVQAKDQQIEQAVQAAKSAEQQAQYLSQALSLKQPITVQVPTTQPQAQNPNVDAPAPQPLVIPDEDRSQVMSFVAACQKCQNQQAADQADIADLKKQVAALKDENSAKDAEIKAAKGSHLKRLGGAVKEVIIGVAIGYAANKLSGH